MREYYSVEARGSNVSTSYRTGTSASLTRARSEKLCYFPVMLGFDTVHSQVGELRSL